MDGPPPKRSRLEIDDSPSPSPLPDFKHDEEFWFSDGSIILVAQNVAFRVFGTLIRSQSSVFSDMFSSASRSAAEEYDRCPVVNLTDSAEDLRYLLRVLIPTKRIRYFEKHPDITFDEMSAVIRLSHKYQIDSVLQQAVKPLKHYYTSSFATWSGAVPMPFSAQGKEHCITAVNLARLLDIPSILPVALYDCCALGGKLVYGRQHKDLPRECLSTDDLSKCFEGRDQLAREGVGLVGRIFGYNSEQHCKTPSRCESSLRAMQTLALTNTTAGAAMILSSWSTFIEGAATPFPLCGLCTKALLMRDAEERHEVWKKLPSFFGLEIEKWDTDGA